MLTATHLEDCDSHLFLPSNTEPQESVKSVLTTHKTFDLLRLTFIFILSKQWLHSACQKIFCLWEWWSRPILSPRCLYLLVTFRSSAAPHCEKCFASLRAELQQWIRKMMDSFTHRILAYVCFLILHLSGIMQKWCFFGHY